MRQLLVILTVLILSLGAGPCQKKDTPRSRVESLQDASRRLGSALRWGHYENAEAYIVSRAQMGVEDVDIDPEGDEPAAPVSLSENVRISLYKIKEVLFNDDSTRAWVTADIEYYRTDNVVVRKTSYEQFWWYHEEGQRWFLEGSLPEF